MFVTLLTSHEPISWLNAVGIGKHVSHVRDTADVPRTDILVERQRHSAEHGTHARDTADVPRTDILVERSEASLG